MVSTCPGGPARSDGPASRTTACAGMIPAGIAASRAMGASAGRSSDGAVVVPAGSVAAASMAQQRCGIFAGRGAEDGQCAMQQAIARSSAMAARGAATAIRAVMPTARTITQAVSRFRDTDTHCMSGRSN